MKILNAAETKRWDAFTIEHERIKSHELMNRAAQAFVRWFCENHPSTTRPVWIFCGTGNNGGDGLAVGRILFQKQYSVKIFVAHFQKKYSPDFDSQLKNLPPRPALPVVWMEGKSALPKVPSEAILIDAIFGAGLSRPLDGNWEILAHHLNHLPNEVVAIDVPSGLFIDRHSSGTVVRANETFSFETPKLAFFFAENQEKIGKWAYASIGLAADFLKTISTPFHFVTSDLVKKMLKMRRPHDHKGSFGHALLLAGSFGKMGAATLAGRGCLRSGTGLLTIHAARSANFIIQTTIPEAMFSADEHENWLSKLPNLERFDAIGVGPGIGTEVETLKVLELLFRKTKKSLVLDADALNLLAAMPKTMKTIPPNAILTPHPKEFERLFGKATDDFARLDLLREKAKELSVFIILKGAHSATACPDGSVFFNSTGNAGMATGGSGDVLTGILTGLLAQGYSQKEACVLGVFLHGAAGDLAAQAMGQEALLASDLAAFLGKAFLELR